MTALRNESGFAVRIWPSKKSGGMTVRILLTAANLDFGRFSRGSVGDADKIGLIAGKNDAGKRKRRH